MTSTHRIMRVEDESIIAMDVQQRLERLGYQVVAQAASGTDAIRTAFEVVPDLDGCQNPGTFGWHRDRDPDPRLTRYSRDLCDSLCG
jgi:hypothetical protein